MQQLLISAISRQAAFRSVERRKRFPGLGRGPHIQPEPRCALERRSRGRPEVLFPRCQEVQQHPDDIQRIVRTSRQIEEWRGGGGWRVSSSFRGVPVLIAVRCTLKQCFCNRVSGSPRGEWNFCNGERKKRGELIFRSWILCTLLTCIYLILFIQQISAIVNIMYGRAQGSPSFLKLSYLLWTD